MFLFTIEFELLWMLFVERFSKIPFSYSWTAFFPTQSQYFIIDIMMQNSCTTDSYLLTLLIFWHRRSSACPPLAVSSSSWGPHHQTWDHLDCIPAPLCTPHTSLRSSRTSWSASSTRSSPLFRIVAQLRVRQWLKWNSYCYYQYK